MRPTRRRTTRGFGLIELVIGVAIVAILATIGTVSYARAQQQSAHRARATMIANAVKEARALARSRRGGFPGWDDGDRVVRAGLRFGGATVAVFVDRDTLEDGTPSAVDVDIIRLEAARGFSVQDAPASIVFNNHGLLTQTDDVDLVIHDDTSGADLTVRVRYGGQVDML